MLPLGPDPFMNTWDSANREANVTILMPALRLGSMEMVSPTTPAAPPSMLLPQVTENLPVMISLAELHPAVGPLLCSLLKLPLDVIPKEPEEEVPDLLCVEAPAETLPQLRRACDIPDARLQALDGRPSPVVDSLD